MPLALPPLRHPVHRLGAREIDFSRAVAVMAVVNRTPDSFFDQGRTFALDSAVESALTADRDGADWVDVGGVPFAPGPPLPWQEEADRVVPVVRGIRDAGSDVVISVDTFDARVAEAALTAGADVINDTTCLSDPDLASVVAEAGAHLVVTHSLAAPRTVYPRPHYNDVTAEVIQRLWQAVTKAVDGGVPESHLFVDPGHDLNKNTEDTLRITRELSEVAAMGFPTLAAVSNKDFIGETLDLPKQDRAAGSIAAAVYCLHEGARVIRMHNVTQSVHAARMFEAMAGWRRPAYTRHNMGEINLP
ncbi:dihydropteroate synthase [Galactobacter sp.]|uniref:dihydropteroate synthase n=1 Tax=Galactobacter sp. TaxID=2676125 RepID=UPI0025BBB7CD|nr:dihydropteroate synthase [Galactobacter sp.]